MLVTLQLVWAWLRKWGGWVVGPIVWIAIALWRSRKAPVLAVDSPVKKEAEASAAKAEQAVIDRALLDKSAASTAHAQEFVVVLDIERTLTAPLVDDPEKANEFLLEAGREARGEPKK